MGQKFITLSFAEGGDEGGFISDNIQVVEGESIAKAEYPSYSWCKGTTSSRSSGAGLFSGNILYGIVNGRSTDTGEVAITPIQPALDRLVRGPDGLNEYYQTDLQY